MSIERVDGLLQMTIRLPKIFLNLAACGAVLLPVAAMGGSSTAEFIAAKIAAESGRDASEHMGYAVRLVRTLHGLSPEALERVLGEHASVVSGDGIPDGGGDPGGEGGYEGAIPEAPLLGAGDHPGAGGVPDGSNDPDLFDLMSQRPPLKSSDLMNILKSHSPLTDNVLVAAINRTPPIKTSDLKAVLADKVPLHSTVLEALIRRSPSMNTSDLKSLLEESVPLSKVVIRLVVDGTAKLGSGDRESVVKVHIEAMGN